MQRTRRARKNGRRRVVLHPVAQAPRRRRDKHVVLGVGQHCVGSAEKISLSSHDFREGARTMRSAPTCSARSRSTAAADPSRTSSNARPRLVRLAKALSELMPCIAALRRYSSRARLLAPPYGQLVVEEGTADVQKADRAVWKHPKCHLRARRRSSRQVGCHENAPDPSLFPSDSFRQPSIPLNATVEKTPRSRNSAHQQSRGEHRMRIGC